MASRKPTKRSAPKISKAALKKELLNQLERALATSERSQRHAHDSAIHEEAKAEDDKDTRAIEQSYLARGQAVRAEGLLEAVTALRALELRAFQPTEAVAIGALVEVEDEDGERLSLFIVPHGGGTKLASGKVQIATPASPLGDALVGRHVGDSIEVPQRGQLRELSIVAVA